jgi:hypothetical protein
MCHMQCNILLSGCSEHEVKNGFRVEVAVHPLSIQYGAAFPV